MKKKIVGVIFLLSLCSFVMIGQAKVMVDNVYYTCQIPSLPTGCELAALEILMRQSGFKVTKEELARNIKKAPNPVWKNGVAYAEHPNNAFVGDPFKDKSYGVYAGGIIDLMEQYMPPYRVQNLTGQPFSQIKKTVDEGRAVMVWSTLEQKEPIPSVTWVTPDGEKFRWLQGEHALVVVGYDDKYIYTSDPAKGVFRKYEEKRFIDVWEKMGSQAIAIRNKEAFQNKEVGVGETTNTLRIIEDISTGERWIPVRELSYIDGDIQVSYIQRVVRVEFKKYGTVVEYKEGDVFKDGKLSKIRMIEYKDITYIEETALREQFEVVIGK